MSVINLRKEKSIWNFRRKFNRQMALHLEFATVLEAAMEDVVAAVTERAEMVVKMDATVHALAALANHQDSL